MTFRKWFFDLSHYANGFLEIERDALFNPIALHNRTPEIVSPFRYMEDDGTISGWYHVGGIRPHIVPQQDMMQLSGTSYDGQIGLNPILLHDETFERARLLNRYITKYLVKGSFIRGSIEIPSTVDPDQEEAIKHTLRTFKGSDHEDDVLLLSGGATLKNSTLSNEQGQIVELQDLSDRQIAQLTDVHPHYLFNDEDGKYNDNITQAGEDVVRYLFRPLIEQAEDELKKLLTDQELDAGYSIHIDPNALTRGDAVTESTLITQQKNAGIITNNESRQELGYPKTNNPEDDKLKTLGDTTPQAIRAQEPPQDEAKQHSRPQALEIFAPVIREAARRVETKTDKAMSAAKAKYLDDPEGMTRWSNVFSEEQARYVTEALEPVLDAMSRVEAHAIDASQIGNKYAQALRGSVARQVRGESADIPSLEALILKKVHHEEA
jgi:HK97 family phage portal protein